MKPHHTPGPWAVHGLAVYTESHVPHRITPRDPAPRYVGHAMWADMYGDDGLYDNMPAFLEAEANARLMAASPELLSCLQWLADSVSDGLESPEAWDYALPDIKRGLERAREAIAKARG